MPLQNRVTPFGEIVAIAQRGRFTGNRGIIHDPVTKTLLGSRWASKAWLICVCAYRGRRREVMGGRSWTELFFLDEAVALAAGHRPCFACRREDAVAFRTAWAATGTEVPSASAMDAVLHRERIDSGKKKRVHALPGPIAQLPDGTVVVAGGQAYTVSKGQTFRWTEEGYEAPTEIPHVEGMLTPPSTYRALVAGYRPILHPSLKSSLEG